ncbi:hypothetical protein IRJ41_022382 [Triplophysa rosa]|uniref:Uncharacterized protein n=1 Tax=Triplophysa rosa TaxID=992332 RepID=A0A9W7X1A0_TRIRA|nr:hypothetical protein IRJ41_022382 [Triplophysa rosa]
MQLKASERVQSNRKIDTPGFKGPARGGRNSQPHGRVGAASRAGAVWKVRGGASSSSQDSEGNSGRMGRILPAGHQPTHPTKEARVCLFVRACWEVLLVQGGPLHTTHTPLSGDLECLCEALTGAFKLSSEMLDDRGGPADLLGKAAPLNASECHTSL